MSGQEAAGSGDPRQADPVQPAGMGRNPSGPEFLPAAPPPPDALPPPTAATRAPRRQHSPWPDILSVALIAVVALIVLVASVVARYGDTHIAAPTPVTEPTIRPEQFTPNEIEFMTPNGSGRLILLSRNWRDAGRDPPANGTYLQLEVKIICTEGRLGYDPYNFQAFDHNGELFDVAEAGLTEDVLGVGDLLEGQSVHGYLAFDIPRGEVTLLMSDDSEQSITALKVPD